MPSPVVNLSRPEKVFVPPTFVSLNDAEISDLTLNQGLVHVRLPDGELRPNIAAGPRLIRGQGWGRSRVRLLPEGARLTGIYVKSGVGLRLHDFTLIGKDRYVNEADDFHLVFFEPGASAIEISRMQFLDAAKGIKMNGGPYVLRLTDVRMDMLGNSGVAGSGGSGFGLLATTQPGELSHGEIIWDGGEIRTERANHCVYIYPGVSTDFKNVIFASSGDRNYGFQSYGDLSQVAMYCRLSKCSFLPGVTFQLLTNPNTLTEVSQCTFELGGRFNGTYGIAVRVRGPVSLTDCPISGRGSIGIDDFFTLDCSVDMVRGSIKGYFGLAAIYRAQSSGLWKFSDLEISNTNDDGTAFGLYSRGGGTTRFDDCIWTRGPHHDASSQHALITNGTLILNRGRVLGNRSIWITASEGPVTVQVDATEFNSSDPLWGQGGLVVQQLGSYPITITGSGSFPNGGAPVFVGTNIDHSGFSVLL